MSIPKWSGNLKVRGGLLTAFWVLLGTLVEARALPVPGPPAQDPPTASASTPADEAGPDPKPAADATPRHVIILEDGADVGDFLKKLAGPYLLIQKPAFEPSKPATDDGPAGTEQSRDYVVDSVKLEGSAAGERAHLVVWIHCTLLNPGPTWVPIRLDDQMVLSAREGERELELRQVPEEKQWEARLEGKGEHQLRIELSSSVRIGAERRSLELAIPLVKSTSFSLNLPRQAFEADLGAGEAVGQEALPDGKGVRLFAHATPRSRLVISWSEESGAGSRVPPMLAAQVEMAVNVDSEAVTTRSKWVIRCVRGISRSIQIRLEDEEVVSRLQFNDQFPASGIEQSKGGNLLTIPLSEPMHPGDARPLVLETRRPLSAGSGKTLTFSGYPLTNAGEQSGILGISQGENLWVGLVNSQGLRRIDPRDLPSALLAQQPNTSIAFQFLDQPFRLLLGVEEAPPEYSADSTTKLTIDADQVRNETTIEVKRVRGRLFEIEIGLAPELKLVTAGPDDLIESTTPSTQERGGGAPARSEQVLKLRLTALARDQKSLSIKLVGRQEAPASGDVRLGLFTPLGAVSTSASFSVYTGRDLTIESLDETLFDDARRDASTPDGRLEARLSNVFGGAKPPSLRLRSARNPSVLKARIQRHPLELAHESQVAARVTRREVDVRQETTLRVRYGGIRSLNVKVPARIASRWNVSGKESITREDLGATQDGARRFRLNFDREVVDASVLVFLYHIPLGRSLDPAASRSLPIPWIQVEEGTPAGCTFDLTSDADVRLAAEDPSWSRIDGDDPDRPDASASGVRRRLIPGAAAPDGLNVTAGLIESVALPRLIVSRALLAATLGADDELRIHAWYALDAHPASLALSLPEGARWIKALVGGRVVEQIEPEKDGTSYRFNIPPESAGRPAVVEIEYQAAAKTVARPWEPPKLLEDAEVLQSYWLVKTPWNMALVGLPGGWADENRWYWDRYVWKRRPVATLEELIDWVAGPTTGNTVEDGLPVLDDSHGYLFGRTGPPTALNAWVVSRAWIIVVCSGLILALGFAASLPRVGERWVRGSATVAGLLAAMFLHPSTIGLFLQSASSGFVLTLFGYLIHRMLRREEAASGPRPAAPSSSGAGGDSSQRSALGVGSDDSTAVRVRVSSTMDYLSLPPSAGAGLEPTGSSPLSGNAANT